MPCPPCTFSTTSHRPTLPVCPPLPSLPSPLPALPCSAVWLTSLLDVAMLRSTFVTSLARFTMLHSPASMRLKHARAFRWGGRRGGMWVGGVWVLLLCTLPLAGPP